MATGMAAAVTLQCGTESKHQHSMAVTATMAAVVMLTLQQQPWHCLTPAGGGVKMKITPAATVIVDHALHGWDTA